MSFTGAKKRKIDCGALNVGGDGVIGNNLYVMNDLTVDGTITGGGIVIPSLTLPNGSASAPSLNFTADTKSGYYWDTTGGSTGQSWSAAGTKKLKLTPSSYIVSTDINNSGWSVTTGNVNATNGVFDTDLQTGTFEAGTATIANHTYTGDGTSSAPGYSFVSDHKTGFCHASGPKLQQYVDGQITLESTSTSMTGYVPLFMGSNNISCNNATLGGTLTLTPAAINGFLSTDSSHGVTSTNTSNSCILTAGDGTNGFTMSQQSGTYVRIGPLVYVSGIVAWTGKGSAVAGSDLVITGLPYTSVGINYTGTVGVISGTWTTSANMSVQFNTAGTSFLNVYQNPVTGASTRVSCGLAPTSGGIRFTIFYLAN